LSSGEEKCLLVAAPVKNRLWCACVLWKLLTWGWLVWSYSNIAWFI